MATHKKVIIDTGPLVAFINKHDKYHEWVKKQLALIHPPLLTCEGVLSEAAFLLRNFSGGSNLVLEYLRRDLLCISFSIENEVASIQNLMLRYNDLPMSFADACLVRMAEQHHDSAILTLDSDFQVYRKNRGQIIPLLFP